MADTSDALFDALAAELARPFGARGRQAVKLRAALRLALDFTAWRRLSAEGLTDREAAELLGRGLTPRRPTPKSAPR
jgi:hypothetical protein